MSASAKGAKPKPGDKEKPEDKKAAPSAPEVQLYLNEYTTKLKESLKKKLQATKGFPEKLKPVFPP